MLTIEQLKKMKPGIFAFGIDLNRDIKWVATRGNIYDWAIYLGRIEDNNEYIKKFGNKIYDESFIKELVPCNDEAWNMYRF